MNTIEDRLLADTNLLELSPDWDDVVGRADRRSVRSQTTARAVIAGFAVFLVSALLLRNGYSIDTVDTPPVTEPDPSPITAPWTESAPSVIVLRALLAWGGSAIVGGIAFFISPRDFRRPYIIPRISRLAATGVWIALYNAALLAITGVALTATDSPFLAAVHGHAAFIEIATVAIIALLLSVNVKGTLSSIASKSSGFIATGNPMKVGIPAYAPLGTT